MTAAGEPYGPALPRIAESNRSVRKAAGADFRNASWVQRLALVGVLWWVTFEWGPGNETFTPWLLARVVARTDSAWVIPLTALVGFGYTVAQQMASGFTALVGFSIFDRTSRAAWNRLRGQSDTAPGEWSRLGWAARSAIVFPLGTTSVALIQIMTTGEVGVRRHRRVVATSAVLCATLVGAIGAVAAGLAFVGRNVPAMEGATNWILRVLGNPLLWLTLIVVSVGGRKILTLRDRTDASNDEWPV
jgi:hypothetical protein